MPETTMTKQQMTAIKRVDKILATADLKTYTQLEEFAGMMGTAAMESIEMGKQLVAKLDKVEAELTKIKGDSHGI